MIGDKEIVYAIEYTTRDNPRVWKLYSRGMDGKPVKYETKEHAEAVALGLESTFLRDTHERVLEARPRAIWADGRI